MRAAIYARVSTEDQAREGFSIPAQLKRLNAYCRARGWQVVGEYHDDGHSGRDANRPEYKRMMAEKDRWDVLVVLKMDRIHRNSRNFNVMMDNLKEWGKEFNSMSESFDTTTAIGRFVMDIIQRIAQLESEQIGERVKVGMTQKARMRKGMLGFAEPYGYRLQDGTLVPLEQEAEVVREIFRRYLALQTVAEIADALNRRGVPTKKGGPWRKGTVSKILRSPLYIGYLSWDSNIWPKHHAEIVDLNAFKDVQALMGARQRAPGKRKNRFCAPGGELND